MRALALVSLVFTQVHNDTWAGVDADEMDYKDGVAIASSVYGRIAEEAEIYDGYTMKTRVPDGYSCPRAFSKWDDYDFVFELAAFYGTKTRAWRKAKKMAIRRRLAQ